MIDLIQPITVQQSDNETTHARRWSSWNWWWRKVDDDDGDDFPSPEPWTGSISALPTKNRGWQRLDIVERDESFSLIFFSPNVNIWSWSWGRWRSREPTRQGARPSPLWIAGGSPPVDSFANTFYLFQKYSPWIFRSFRELLFLHKNNTKAILLKTASVWVSSIQIMQIRVRNKGKRVWKSRYDGDVSSHITFWKDVVK